MLNRVAIGLIAGLFLQVPVSSGQTASASAVAAELKGYLPVAKTFAAEYVVIEPDPNFDVYVRRFRAAQEANREWFAAYGAQHAGKELPYHPNFGVSEAEYIRYKSPMNQFREVSRKRIQVEKRATGSKVNLRVLGENLLLNDLEIETDTPTAKTPKGVLVLRSVVKPLERASLPPAAHQGILFETPDATIAKEKFRESVLVGKLKGTSTGIVHYSLNTPGRVQMAYVVYSLGN